MRDALRLDSARLEIGLLLALLSYYLLVAVACCCVPGSGSIDACPVALSPTFVDPGYLDLDSLTQG